MTAYATIVLTVNAEDQAWVQGVLGGLLDHLKANTQHLPYLDFTPSIDNIAEGLLNRGNEPTSVVVYDVNGSIDDAEIRVLVDTLDLKGGTHGTLSDIVVPREI